MTTLRIPFASQRQRDLALALVTQLDFVALDKSEPAGAGIRPLAGDTLGGVRDGRRQLVFKGEHIPQWAAAIAASLAWRWGRRQPETPWAQLFMDEELLLVAATSQDVRGTRGLLEVDSRGKLLAWRDGGRTKAGPRLLAQNKAVDLLLSAMDKAEQETPRKKAPKTS